MNQMSWFAVPLVFNIITVATKLHHQGCKSSPSRGGLNPAHVPYQWLNIPTLDLLILLIPMQWRKRQVREIKAKSPDSNANRSFPIGHLLRIVNMCLIHVYAGMVKPSWTFVTANLFENKWKEYFFQNLTYSVSFPKGMNLRYIYPVVGLRLGGARVKTKKEGPLMP